jgi:hypothetical protein
MNSVLAITSAMLLIGGACNKDANVQRLQDQPTRQQINSAADTSSWRTYTNTKFGFEFRYPNHWNEANTVTDKANVIWINFSSSSAGSVRNVLYVKVFPDRHAFSVEEKLIAGNATATQVTVDKTTQNLYGDFLDVPTVMISNNGLLVEIGDPSHEGYLKQILATFRFSR